MVWRVHKLGFYQFLKATIFLVTASEKRRGGNESKALFLMLWVVNEKKEQ